MKNPRTMYLRDSYPGNAIGCLATILDVKSSTIKYQISTINPVDKFDADYAKELAMARLNESPEELVVMYNTHHDLVREIMKDIITKPFPTRVKKSAKLWLRKPRALTCTSA